MERIAREERVSERAACREGLAFHVPEFRIEPLPRPELRKDPIIDRWVIISTDRLGRPVEFVEEPPLQPLLRCPFCAGHEEMTPPPTFVSPVEGPWRVRVVPNTFPAVRGEPTPLDGDDPFRRRRAASGLHEVIVACPQHESRFARLPADQWAIVFQAFQARLRFLSTLPTTHFPVIFANQGSAAGASLEHPHIQLVTLPTSPELMALEWESSRKFFRERKKCIYCVWLESERNHGLRVVLESPRFVVLSAYAARCPAECWILPRRHESHFEVMDDREIQELGQVFHELLRRFDRGLCRPPLNFYLHSSPPFEPGQEHYHWHIEVLPRLTGIAGFEWGAGMNINPVPPEQAAVYLRSLRVDEREKEPARGSGVGGGSQ
jgi:UDPglucose--hexose-1-phosphate uridylyltransferase